jgi:2-polyprenyl-6-hydroxyphenyl methylase/3-demethylubiquinone-9 3-methyltransferase
VTSSEDVKAYFDREAIGYREQHGPATNLLQYRLGLIRRFAAFQPQDQVLEIGCGPGNHLVPLAGMFASALGTDLSDEMIRIARRRAPDNVRFGVDNAESLSTVTDAWADVVLCVGAFEHMIDRRAVLRSVHRVLRPGGRFVCLTPNGDFVWYRWLAPRLRWPTVRLSTDRFLGRGEVASLCEEAGFRGFEARCWSFIPRGDMSAFWARVLGVLDGIGHLGISSFRGGLVFRCRKPFR